VNLPQHTANWLLQRTTANAVLTMDSRAVRSGDVFFALPGATVDGRRFMAQATNLGAKAIVAEHEGFVDYAASGDAPLWSETHADTNIALVPQLASQLGAIADSFYGAPSQKMHSIAVTGTNGKTSCTQWIAQVLQALDIPCATIGTLGAGAPDKLKPFGLTTPDALTMHGLLRKFLEEKFQAVAFEASSIGMEQGRLNAVHVDTAVYTNLSQDHLDYHGDMERYAAAKAKLFAWPGLKQAVVNLDDAYASLMLAQCKPGVRKIGYTLQASSEHAASVDTLLRAQSLCFRDGARLVQLSVSGAQQEPFQSTIALSLVGDFNVSNVLAVLGAVMAQGVPAAQIYAQLANLRSVLGRMQLLKLPEGQPAVVLDYAHTPDALEKTLLALRADATARNGRLVCVFGAGGDRDASKRPLMGAVAAQYADAVVLTSDNPRSEDPQTILAQILAGVKTALRDAGVTVIADRRAAIAHALRSAGTNDLILLAGKGHEQTQEIAGVKYPFSDEQVVLELVAKA
jgi:UDP-N-acetylmuramoyl-L-alanyl-D-glutamate--2,6-diaminopimelate ligase